MAALARLNFSRTAEIQPGRQRRGTLLSHPFSIDNSSLSRRAPPARGMLSAQSRRTYAGQAGDLS
jgi:hypothetical protein